jgi:hypothetical protein
MEGAMRGKEVVCMQCDLPERTCTCDKFCYLCKGDFGIRLCEDGLYYCPDCREACDLRVAESHG